MSRVIPEKLYTRAVTAPPQKCPVTPGALQGSHRPSPAVAAAGAAQYTELFRMPQQSTMLRIISKICGGLGGTVSTGSPGGRPERMPSPCTHHDHSNHDGRNADEVQLPREEVIDLLMAVLLGWAGGDSPQTVRGAGPRAPTVQRPGSLRKSREGLDPLEEV